MKVGLSSQNSFMSHFAQQQRQNQQQQRQELINRNYSEIYSHELAHKTAGGSLAGAIVIEKNPDGIPIGGHVSIKMPSLNRQNPQKTIDDANTVIRSAMAPCDPSEQDYRVANQARAIKREAISLKHNQKLGNRLDVRA